MVAALLIATLAAQLTSLAFGRIHASQSFLSIVGPSALVLTVITLPLCWLGLRLGRPIGLGRLLTPSVNGSTPVINAGAWKGIALMIGLSLGLGAALLLLREFTAPFQPTELPAFGQRGVIGGLAVSLGAAVAEEVWFRLGLMTILVWFVVRLSGAERAGPGIIWPIIIVTGLGFGLAHLPQLVSHGAGSAFAISGTILGNTAVGTLYGWVYWRQGLIAAMLSHFLVDLVLHVMPALV